MNRILNEVRKIIDDNIKKYLPEVKPSDLEENGKVYYMNGRNGTAFEWYVNEHFPSFMVFYDDEQNLGAVKMLVDTDGKIVLLLYGDKGNELVKEINTKIEVKPNELFDLAVVLSNEADSKSIWDASIELINTEVNASDEQIEEFKNQRENFKELIESNKLMNKTAFLSKKILDEGWKIGYMCRDESLNENDSGWSFFAGDEDDEYTSDYNNMVLIRLYQVTQLDPDTYYYIDSPEGSRFIRISSSKFELDNNDKEIYMEKRVQE